MSSAEKIKMHWNPAMSLDGVRHITIDLKFFYLELGSLEHDCIRIKLSIIPDKFSEEHNLHDLVNVNMHVCAEVRSGIHGSPQVGRLAHEDLVSNLSQCSHKPVKSTLGIWKHTNNGISFTLVVNDFGIKCHTMKSLNH